MDGLGLSEEDRLQAALTFLATKATRWYTLAIQRSGRPAKWTLFKVKLMELCAPYSAAEALYRLRQVTPRGTMRDFIDGFNGALADWEKVVSREPLRIFAEGLHPGIGRLVRTGQPFLVSDATQMTVYLYADVEAANTAPPRPLASSEANLRTFGGGDRTGYWV